MTKTYSIRLPVSSSDNPKSAIQKRPRGLKWVGIFAIVFTFAFGGVEALAQQPVKVTKIGLLVPTSQSTAARSIKVFQQSLGELGYVEGKNIIIEYRYAEGKMNMLPELAAELARLKVDVLVTNSRSAIEAANNATKTIPIVFAATADPVKDGIVSSLARPGGNVTGLTLLAPELNGKRLELLKEALPRVTRVAFLRRTGSSGNRRFKEAEAVAKTLGLRLQYVGAKDAEDFESAFRTAKSAGAQALTMSPSPFLTTHLARIVNLATKNLLPGIYPTSTFVEAGGLMSYGPDILDNWRHAATYVDKILKGTKPADLPVQQPMKFEFAINLKTAKQIGLTIPPNVLVRANRVIR